MQSTFWPYSVAMECKRRLCGRAVQAVVFFGVIAAVWGLLVALTVLYNVSEGLPDDVNQFKEFMHVMNESNTSTSLNCTGSAVCNASKVVCSDGFYVGDEAGLSGCKPECGEWEEFPHSSVAFDVFVVLQAVVCIVSSVIVVVLSAIRYKRMFEFPSILIVYTTVPLAFFELFLLIGYKNRQKLFCSSRDLIESLKSPTAFCSLQGAVFYYNVLQLTLLWFFHILVLFWGIKFPISYKSLKKRGHVRYLHICIVLLSVMLPGIPVAVGFGTGGYTTPRFPPTICSATNSDATFFSLILPVTLLMALGVSLVIAMFCLLCARGMDRNQPTHPENGSINLRGHVPKTYWKWKAEIKLLVIFCYFFMFLAVSQTALTIALRNQPIFIIQLKAYFLCESMGVPGNNCERSFGRFNSKVSLVISYLFLGLYPIINLIYVVNVKELKNSCSRTKENCTISGMGSMPQLTISSSDDHKTEI